MRISAFANTQHVEVIDHLDLQELRLRTSAKRALLVGVRPTPHLLALLSVTSGLALCAIVLLTNSFRVPLPGISAERFDYQRASFVSPSSSRERLLERLEVEQKRELAINVHFLGGIIDRTNPKLSNQSKRIAHLIATESKAANIDPFLVAAVVKSESSFRSSAKSPVGALGLMQVMPRTGQYVASKYGLPWNGKARLQSDPGYNLTIGIAYLQYLLERYNGDLKKVLWAYNWGPANVQRLSQGRARLPSVTKKYAATILSDYSRWSDSFDRKQSEYQFFNASYLELLS